MVRKVVTLFALLLMLQASNAFAHAGGHGPVSEEMARAIALDAANQFSEFDPGLGFGRLGASWQGLSEQSVTIVTRGEGYYIVGVENRAEGKTMYVLMSRSGDIYDANFTGEFPKVK
ncbi:MAG: DUF6488 family protein [Chromatiales bacterium]|nr:DUF6488 family protein [Chromatiales bacterium]